MESLGRIKNVLLTGSTGFIGSHVLKSLSANGYNVIALKRSTSNLWRIKGLKNIKFYDIDKTKLSKIFSENNIDIVVHIATKYIKSSSSSDEKTEMQETNIAWPTQLLDLCVKHNVNYFINTGTFFEYKPSKLEIKEDSDLQPFNFYASTKIEFRNVLIKYSKKGIKAITLTLFSPYGEKDNRKLMVALVDSGINNKEMKINKGTQVLNWTYVADIVDAYLKAIDFIQKMESDHELFNVCSDEVLSIKDCVKIIGKNLQKINIDYSNDPIENEIFYSKGSNSKAKKILKWSPKFKFEEGIKRMITYYKGNPNDLQR